MTPATLDTTDDARSRIHSLDPTIVKDENRLQLVREFVGFNVPSFPLTEKTVGVMAGYIRRGARDPIVKSIAREIRLQAKGDEVARVWWWAKTRLHFVHHDKQICQMTGECSGPGNYQMLIEPAALVRLHRMEGDCAVYTMIVLALLTALGHRGRIATVEADRRRPGEYTHVYAEAWVPELGLWCPLDASHGDGPGWEVPARDIARKTEWDLNGSIVADSRPRPISPEPAMPSREPGLAGYVAAVRGMGQPQPAPPIEVPPPLTQAQKDAALAQSQADYNARAARCVAFQKKERALVLGAGALMLFALPGWWKLLALPVTGFAFVAGEFGAVPALRSSDCDYGW